ncbi:hypothetical protein P692DRAFT_20457751 [Suillus brevipes Sb2]|nr:hypothetical protein P692DRAFT_20457751 [Suillus brevipes Sb2]
MRSFTALASYLSLDVVGFTDYFAPSYAPCECCMAVIRSWRRKPSNFSSYIININISTVFVFISVGPSSASYSPDFINDFEVRESSRARSSSTRRLHQPTSKTKELRGGQRLVALDSTELVISDFHARKCLSNAPLVDINLKILRFLGLDERLITITQNE